METKDNIYSGNTRVYLQGKGALQALDTSSSEFHTYYVGTEESLIIIKDCRPEPVRAAKAALENNLEVEFADIFNQPAYVKIFTSYTENEIENIEIDLHPTHDDSDYPVLWLGVIDDLRLPMLDTQWEFLRPISLEKVAFVAFIKGVSSINNVVSEKISSETVYSFD